jgi:(2S)-methylsuccinyl-CoA dehydrogenase
MTEVNSGMQAALRYLAAADALIKKSLSWIKQQCIGNKGVSNEKLDEHQLASFDLAWCAAESTGARFAIAYADQVAAAGAGAGACLEQQNGPGFLRRGAAEHPQSFVGAAAELRSQRRRPGASGRRRPQPFLPDATRCRNLEALGRQVVALNGGSGAYMLATMRR